MDDGRTHMKGARRLVALLAAGAMCLAGCAASEPEVMRVSRAVEGPDGVLGFQEPVTDGFTVAILPDADGNIYQITMDYALGSDWEGRQTMVTEDGASFDRQNVILKKFSAKDLEGAEIPPLTLALTMTDEQGHHTAALNTYTIESPQYEGEYLLKITGDEEQGYRLSDT